VSHDRAFLERTVTDVIVLDGAGSAGRRPGGYAAWEEQRRAGRGRTSPKAGAASRPAPGPVPAPSGPSPSTLRHQLKQADKEVERLRLRRRELEAELIVAVDDHERMATLGARLAETTTMLDQAEEAWLAIAEQLEGRGGDRS
jgi:ABC transport system ATP-binding/permease protein